MSVRLGRRWTQKPPTGSQIDRSHPWASGLRSAYLVNEGAGSILRDTVSGLNMTPTESAISWSSGPDGWMCGNQSSYPKLASSVPSRSWGEVTAIIACDDTRMDGWGAIFAIGGTNISFRADWAPGTGSNLQFRVIGDSPYADTTLPAPVAQGGRKVVGLVYGAGRQEVWLAGSKVASALYDTGILYNYSAQAIKPIQSAGGIASSGWVRWCYVWDRALEPAEVAGVTARPFEFVLPPSQSRFLPPSGTGPGGFKSAWFVAGRVVGIDTGV